MKTKAADTVFSRCVREAHDWTCTKCNTKYERGSQGLHNSHNYSRRHRTIRWCKENTIALCFSCHQWYGGNPIESGAWVRNLLGDEVVDILIEKMNSRAKVPKSEEKLIAKHYREQLTQILLMRDEGVTGYIEFVSYQ